jgi:hypothetical protein
LVFGLLCAPRARPSAGVAMSCPLYGQPMRANARVAGVPSGPFRCLGSSAAVWRVATNPVEICCNGIRVHAGVKEAHRARVQTRVRFQRRGLTGPIRARTREPEGVQGRVRFALDPGVRVQGRVRLALDPRARVQRRVRLAGFGPQSPSPRVGPIWQGIYLD